MARGPSLEKTEQTRARILGAAETLLSERGYSSWTMRELAERAECAVGLLYRYFPTREALVVGLYGELARTVDAQASALAAGTVGERFAALVSMKLRELDRKPRVFRALAHAALAPDEGAGVFSDETSHIRDVGMRAFTRVAAEATNPPSDPAAMGRVLYGLHLLFVLLWTQRAHKRRSDPMHAFIADIAPLIDLASATPFFAPTLKRIDALARSFLENPS